MPTIDLFFCCFLMINLKSYPVWSYPVCPLLNDGSVTAVELDYPLEYPHNFVWTVGSCNGFLCLADKDNVVSFWNPTTRTSYRLPNSGVKLGPGWYIKHGFGYDGCTDDYKVVGISCFFRDWDLCETEVKVYTLRTGCWKRIGDFPHGVPWDDSGKFANGALHWTTCRDLGPGSTYSWIIVSLDLAKETYSEVDEGDFYLTLGVLGECLCVLCNYRGTRADVWVMKEYGVRESWNKLVTIPYFMDPGEDQYSVPLYISKNGEILLEFGSHLVRYNPKNNSFKYPEIPNFDVRLQANTYIESLVPPNINNMPERHQ